MDEELEEGIERAANVIEVGKLAYHANIDFLDEEILFGAFLEIARNMNDEKKLKQWKENTRIHLICSCF